MVNINVTYIAICIVFRGTVLLPIHFKSRATSGILVPNTGEFGECHAHTASYRIHIFLQAEARRSFVLAVAHCLFFLRQDVNPRTNSLELGFGVVSVLR